MSSTPSSSASTSGGPSAGPSSSSGSTPERMGGVRCTMYGETQLRRMNDGGRHNPHDKLVYERTQRTPVGDMPVHISISDSKGVYCAEAGTLLKCINAVTSVANWNDGLVAENLKEGVEKAANQVGRTGK